MEEKKADGVPDILLNPNAVLNDSARWRHGSTPDYSKANANYAAQKSKDWEKGSLEDMVSNLVKNWEKEASYKVLLGAVSTKSLELAVSTLLIRRSDAGGCF